MLTTPVVPSGAVLDALFELAPDPVWLVDEEGTVVRFNEPFGWWRAATPSIAETLDLTRQRALGGHKVMADVRGLVGGIERTFAVHALHLPGVGVLFMARDLGEPAVLADDAATERALLHLFTSQERLDAILPKALELLGTNDGADAAILWLGGAEELRPASWWFRAEGSKLAKIIPSFHFRSGHGVPGRAFATREVVWIADILEETTMRRTELSLTGGLHSVVAIPMTDSADVIGVLELFTRAIRPISEQKKRLLARTGEALGRLVARRRGDEERRHLLELIERKSTEWMSTFDSIEMPIFLVAWDGTIARLNRAASVLAGSSFDEVVGRGIATIGGGEPGKTLHDISTAVRDSGMPCTAQVVCDDHTWDVSASLLAATAADDRRVIIALHETTEVLKLQESVRRSEQLAALGELLAGVAHEVKNPIFGMSMTLELLDRVPHDDESAELLGAMRSWLGRLSALMENLLEYGKTWTVDLRPGTIDPVVQQAIEVCAPLASSAQVTVECEGDSAGGVVLMDGGRLSHVFENLLTNAIEFSPAGERVTISIKSDAKSVELSVRDRGPGFRPDDLPRVFQPFFTRRRGGTGLGLAIAQRIVDEHGGTINAGNGPDQGAFVVVCFPKYES